MLHTIDGFRRIGEENAFAVLARAGELAAKGKDIINLGIGQPDFRTPDHIVEAAIKALRDGEHGYTPATGIPKLREAVAADILRRTGVEVSPGRVIIVPGGKITMFAAIEMFGEPGADILYPDPGFPIYRSMIEFTGARPVPIPIREANGFAFSAEETLSLITPETRLIILNSPANPTGGVTPKAEIDARVREVAQVVQISELLDRKPRALSGGQRQRVALGRAIIRRPSVFLMDEPLSNLDAKLRLHTRGELKRFQRELATTTIYVTHDQAEAMTLADRVAIMSGGLLQQVGPPKDVYARPGNAFVAGFLGSPPMNLLTTTISSRDGEPVLLVGEQAIPARGSLADRLQRVINSEGKVQFGLRPEDVLLGQGSASATSGEVFVVEDLGNERLITLDPGGQFMVARAPADFPAEMGQKLSFSFDPGRAHLFDIVTGLRVD